MNPDNVIRVPPRRYRVFHKGMHGWVEYHPGTKSWTYKLKYHFRFENKGTANTEAEAVLALKSTIDTLSGGGTSVWSVD